MTLAIVAIGMMAVTLVWSLRIITRMAEMRGIIRQSLAAGRNDGLVPDVKVGDKVVFGSVGSDVVILGDLIQGRIVSGAALTLLHNERNDRSLLAHSNMQNMREAREIIDRLQALQGSVQQEVTRGVNNVRLDKLPAEEMRGSGIRAFNTTCPA